MEDKRKKTWKTREKQHEEYDRNSKKQQKTRNKQKWREKKGHCHPPRNTPIKNINNNNNKYIPAGYKNTRHETQHIKHKTRSTKKHTHNYFQQQQQLEFIRYIPGIHLTTKYLTEKTTTKHKTAKENLNDLRHTQPKKHTETLLWPRHHTCPLQGSSTLIQTKIENGRALEAPRPGNRSIRARARIR